MVVKMIVTSYKVIDTNIYIKRLPDGKWCIQMPQNGHRSFLRPDLSIVKVPYMQKLADFAPRYSTVAEARGVLELWLDNVDQGESAIGLGKK